MTPFTFSSLYFKHILLSGLLVLGSFGCAQGEEDSVPSIPDPPNVNGIVITDELALKMDIDVPGQDLQAMLFPKESRPKDEIEQIMEDQKAKKRQEVQLALEKQEPAPKEEPVEQVEEPEADVDTLLSGEVLQDPSEEAILSGFGAMKSKSAQTEGALKDQEEEEELGNEVPLEKIKPKRSYEALPKRNISRHTSLNESTPSKSTKSPVSFDSAVIP